MADDTPEAGVCRCCLSQGRFHSLWKTYTWLEDTDSYGDLLRDCFNLEIEQEKDTIMDLLICGVCIERLRNAASFKLQVMQSGEAIQLLLQQQRTIVEGDLEEENVGSHNDLEGQLVAQGNACNGTVSGDDEENVITVIVEAENDNGMTAVPECTEVPFSLLKMDLEHKEDRVTSSQTGAIHKSSTSKGQSPAPVPSKLAKKTQDMVEIQCTRFNASLLIANTDICPFRARHNLYKCFYCDESFLEPDLMRCHTFDQHNHKKADALIYMKTSPTAYVDITNMTCSICKESYDQLNNLIKHLKDCHDVKFKNGYSIGVIPFKLDCNMLKCHECSQTFYTFHTLSQHMNEHFECFVCSICGTKHATRLRMQRHLTTHKRGEFQCDHCHCIYESKVKLKLHIERVHGKKKSAVCSLCSERFADYEQKQRHLENCHNQAPKQFKCQFCDNVYTTKRLVANHVRRDHIKLRNHICEFCPKQFYLKSQLDSHILSHTKEKPFSCNRCGKRFGRKSEFATHKRTHCSRNVCNLCDQRFHTKIMCLRHKREAHKNAVLYY